jgi:hypothetical protein
MAPPSRPSLTLKAAKALEVCSESLIELTPSNGDVVASRTSFVFESLGKIADTLSAVKELCDVGMGTYPSHPAIRETMQTAGNQIYRIKSEVMVAREQCIATPPTDLAAWQQIGLRLADLASQLRAVRFVPPKKQKKEGAA